MAAAVVVANAAAVVVAYAAAAAAAAAVGAVTESDGKDVAVVDGCVADVVVGK